MANGTTPIAFPPAASGDLTYTVPPGEKINLQAIRAVFNGSGAASAFLPAVQIKNTNGVVIAQTIGSSVAAGGSADATFFPRVRRAATSGTTLTYYQMIAALSVTNTLVAQWHLTEGASPWADTSGFSPGTPDTQTIQVRFVPMTQNYASGPLASASAGPSVKFNFDGDSRTSQGDFLQGVAGTAARTGFTGKATFSVVAWVRPTTGAATHPGPVVSTVTVTGFGTPGAHDDGWAIDVRSPGQECRLERWCGVTAGNSPDYVSLGAMDTTKWTMVTMTYDGATIRGYANGAFIGSTASAGAIGNAIEAFIGAGGGELGNWIDWYYGACSEISIWSSVLDADEIALLYLSSLN